MGVCAMQDVKLVLNNAGEPRGYAFVEFEREEDMADAYKRANGRKIDGRRVLVDVERGRCVCVPVPVRVFISWAYPPIVLISHHICPLASTLLHVMSRLVLFRTVKGWRPRRFGGGLGGRKAKKSKKELALDEIRSAASFAAASAPGDSGGADRDRERSRDEERDRRRREDDRRRDDERRRQDRDRDRDRDRGARSDRGSDRGGGGGGGASYYGPSGGGGSSSSSSGGRERGGDRDRDRDRDRKRSRERSPAGRESSTRRRY
jgi:U1 small nuclear ribonucleoprotein